MERPGGRTARVRASVLRAAGDALAERGFVNLDLGDLARRAEVGRTTVYRRWGTVTAVLTDLLLEMAVESVPRADTGSLEGDLRVNARLVVKTLTDQRQGPLFKAVLGAATSDDDAAAALTRFYLTRIREWAPCVTDAEARGEIPPGTDAEEVVRAVSAPLYYRFVTGTGELDDAVADRAVAAAVAAAKAGVFSRANGAR
ncbi:TetR/AcrR family transcriptional regulator [Actinophytocola sp.]|uniref:TetR/AcrR family transcriptional regulator n=1 Tax=Actinophytocola sp. TaxID=1872138 RepID=UPI002D72DE6C|nr:TetR/AcrR family transcriptional regulator C-terminal ligand-binding domain-containing protein [Actinophytocola sp.]HYQ66593.1 TetR/AcrR family transcriptional regulator C-terminal ligand-binding domain-containing protein [Actinophytocola sp.]